MGTKNNPGEFDCYADAGPDEPMFTLLARDLSAPKLIREWVKNRRIRKDFVVGGFIRDDAKNQEALRCADMMDAWQRGAALAAEGISAQYESPVDYRVTYTHEVTGRKHSQTVSHLGLHKDPQPITNALFQSGAPVGYVVTDVSPVERKEEEE
jgi:hypothetical protein